MSFWSSLRKITLKGVVKDVEKVALPLIGAAVAGPIGGAIAGSIGSAVSGGHPSSGMPSSPASPTVPSSSDGGILGGIKTLGGDLAGAAGTIGSAEIDRLRRAISGAFGAIGTDINNIATGVKTGASGAGAAIRNSNPTSAAGSSASLWVIVAVIIGALVLFKGKK